MPITIKHAQLLAKIQRNRLANGVDLAHRLHSPCCSGSLVFLEDRQNNLEEHWQVCKNTDSQWRKK